MVTNGLQEIGRCLFFVRELFQTGMSKHVSRTLILEQVWDVTWQSMLTTALAGFFVGGIMTVQFTLQVNEFGALGYLGGLATSATLREVGPLLIAFMLSGKVGAYTSAELGTMKVTEQIDAVRCLGANPMEEIIWPRFVGIIISSFVLLSAGLMMSILGGMLMGVIFSGISPQEYIRHIPTIVNSYSLLSGIFKCAVFAFILASICTYRGYVTTGGAKGVGKAVVQTAVVSMVILVIADWLTTFLAETIRQLIMGI